MGKLSEHQQRIQEHNIEEQQRLQSGLDEQVHVQDYEFKCVVNGQEDALAC